MTMLDRMRRHKGWLKWSLALVVLTFVVFYIPDFVQTQPTVAGMAAPNEVVAEIEGRRLTAGEFQRRYFAQMQAYQNAYGAGLNEQMLRQLGVDQQILGQMIDEQAALAEAERQGLRVSDEELAQQIFSIPGLQENGRFIGEARYEQLLRTQNPPMTKSQFEDELRRGLMIDKLRAALTEWMAVSESDLEREYKDRNEKVKLQVVALTADRFRDQVTASDADVAAHFDANKETYRIGDARKVKYLLIDRDETRKTIAVTPTDIQAFYNQNIQQYQTPEQMRASHILLKVEGKQEADVRKQAEEILAQVKSGADFAELAKKVSEDEASKATGGDLDYFGRGRMVPEFENAAFALEAGQVSELVKTPFGFHIIKVVDKKPAVTRSLDELRAQIQEQLATQKTNDQLAVQATQRDAEIDDPSDLDRVAKEAGLTVQESDFFTRQDPIPGLGPAPEVVTAAFRLNDDEVSAALTSPRGPVFVTVSGKRDPYLPKLEDVKDKVREDVIRARATALSRQRAAEIAPALKSARDFAAAAKALGLEAKDTQLAPRASALPDIGVRPEVDKVAFTLPAGAVSDPVALTDGTVIVRVAERDEVTPAELKQDKETFREQMLNERRTRFFTAYMQRAKQRMKIDVRNDVVQRVINPTTTAGV